jgi:hypothetical protein
MFSIKENETAIMGFQITEKNNRNEAMTWIDSALANIAEVLSLEIVSANWDIAGTANGGTSYQLVIVGHGGKRAVKLFSAAELDRCLKDTELQADLKARLTPLVIFTGSKVHPKATRRTTATRKRRLELE